MSDKRIDEVTPDTNVTGTELVPVSDGGVAKSMTVNQIKDFVKAKIESLTAAETTDISQDSIFIKKDGTIKPISADTLAKAIVASGFSEEDEDSFTGDEIVVIRQTNATKTTTFAHLVDYFKEEIELDAFDIGGLDPFDVVGTDFDVETLLLAIAKDGDETEKISFQSLAEKMAGSKHFGNGINGHSGALTSNESLVVLHMQNDGGVVSYKLQYVTLSDAGFKNGDVVGPAASQAGAIAQFSGTSGKILSSGPKITSTVNAESTSSQIPTAVAVNNALAGKVTAPSGNANNSIPQWDGNNTKTLKNGLYVHTAPGSTPYDDSVLTEKGTCDTIDSKITGALATGASPGVITTAIGTAITNSLSSSDAGTIGASLANKATAPASTTANYIPQWSATQKTLAAGKQLVSTVSSASTNDQIPTAKAVYDATSGADVSNLVKCTSSTTQNKVPKWSSTNKTLEDGYSVSTDITGSAYDSEIPTAKAVATAIKKAVDIVSSQPSSGSYGHQSGEMVYATSTKKLYINVGSSSSAEWMESPAFVAMT